MATLDAAERDIADAVARALADTADEYGRALDDATELVAARFSVARIAGMWARRVPALVRWLLGVVETAAQQTATDVDAELPDGWTDLPARHDDGRQLPDGIGQYVTTTEALLTAVGDRLADAAVRELTAGVDQGETVDQLRARMLAVFARDSAQLGPGREQRIAQTEAVRAWNTAALAAARALTGPDRPLVKQWRTRNDNSVRSTHRAAAGQLRLLDEPFTVAGTSMQAPGDPSAPPALTVNCRCRLAIAPEPRTATAFSDPRESRVDQTAASGPHTGAMIALMPTAEDAERLALNAPGAEPAGELHLTLFYLGEAADWDEEHRADLVQRLTDRSPDLEPLSGRAFGANQWNSNSDEPCWVWAVGDDRDADGPGLDSARYAATAALEDMHRQPELPGQHSPWQPHVCAAYSRSPALLPAMNERLGPVSFDRLRVAFAGEHTDIPLGPPTEEDPMEDDQHDQEQALAARPWSTPADTALAFEDQQTGDGRVFRPGSLYWEGAGPWPLQYADEMLMGHEGAELAGAIHQMRRDGDRITGAGVLYPGQPAGADALILLEEDAPLGVSVDLDDVSVEFVDTTGQAVDEPEDEVVLLAAALPSASFLRLDDGSWAVTATATAGWTASGQVMSRTAASTQLITGRDGRVTAAAVREAFGPTGTLTAGAGDPNPEDGIVLHSESAGDLLMRVTKARVRGATLVAMPAYANARIVLDDDPAGEDSTAAALTAAGPTDAHLRVVAYVKASPIPVGARDVARALGITMVSARGHLARAVEAGRVVRLARGLYVGAATLPEGAELAAAMSGNLDLPVHEDRDAIWDGDAAASRILDWATGDDGQVDAGRLGAGFLYRDEDADPATLAAYKLGYADVVDGELQVIARGVFAVAGALQGARGGVDVPEDERDALRDRTADLYERLAEAYDDPSITAPWKDRDDDENERMEASLAASAWTAMRDVDPMPAHWFKEPTPEELPPSSGGVHYKDGRVYGWVAQSGVPHAGYPGKKITIDRLARDGLDLSHFLRAKFKLDDGSEVHVGAMTMNVGHDRDGAQCENAACQFDNSGTVGAIVTVGMNEGGLWFSGAGAPWLSDWDKTVFRSCQPSYHLKPRQGGGWELRAVLDVPVPGHSSPLVAAVIERSNLALAASAAVVHEQQPDTSDGDTLQTEIDELRRRVVDVDVPDSVDMSAAVVIPDSPAALYPPMPPPLNLDPAFVDAVAAAVTARLDLPASASARRGTAPRTDEEPTADDQRAEIARLEAIVASAAPITPSTEEAR